ncbi:MAG: hypothetical protein DIU71_11080 [Proteobacteria bacterium]|nr:MAG: hypothetical protein DIU71_11080 [Pseudomonadota bacterium]
MSLKYLKTTAALVLATCALSAQAECVYPKAPDTIPDGATATEQEMIAAMQAFKAYDAAVVAFRECVEKESGTSMQAKSMQMRKVNAAVDELQTKAKQFNEQVRVFKARG